METQMPSCQEPVAAPAAKALSNLQEQLTSKKASVREGISRGTDEGKLDCDCGTMVWRPRIGLASI